MGRQAFAVELSYDATQPGSPIRKVSVRGFCMYSSDAFEKSVVHMMPQAFLTDIAQEYKIMMKEYKLNDSGQVCENLEPPCEFHEHESEAEKAPWEANRARAK
jgi:hypothetical protein